MFEKALTEKFQKIFGLKKVRFDLPAEEAPEQECLFIQVDQPNVTVKSKSARARVVGQATVFGSADKIPFGFFAKRIAKADAELTKDLYFFEVEQNTRQFVNIVQRSFSFVFFFNSQYDPEVGTIESVNFQEVETP